MSNSNYGNDFDDDLKEGYQDASRKQEALRDFIKDLKDQNADNKDDDKDKDDKNEENDKEKDNDSDNSNDSSDKNHESARDRRDKKQQDDRDKRKRESSPNNAGSDNPAGGQSPLDNSSGNSPNNNPLNPKNDSPDKKDGDNKDDDKDDKDGKDGDGDKDDKELSQEEKMDKQIKELEAAHQEMAALHAASKANAAAAAKEAIENGLNKVMNEPEDSLAKCITGLVCCCAGPIFLLLSPIIFLLYWLVPSTTNNLVGLETTESADADFEQFDIKNRSEILERRAEAGVGGQVNIGDMDPRIARRDVRKDSGVTGKELDQYVLRNTLKGKGNIVAKYARKHGIDPAVLAAILMTETGGNSNALVNYNNPGGIMTPSSNWQKLRRFPTLEAGLDYTAKNLRRQVESKGTYTIPEIGAWYAPPGASNDPHGTNGGWPSSVAHFMAQAPSRAGQMDRIPDPNTDRGGDFAFENVRPEHRHLLASIDQSKVNSEEMMVALTSSSGTGTGGSTNTSKDKDKNTNNNLTDTNGTETGGSSSSNEGGASTPQDIEFDGEVNSSLQDNGVTLIGDEDPDVWNGWVDKYEAKYGIDRKLDEDLEETFHNEDLDYTIDEQYLQMAWLIYDNTNVAMAESSLQWKDEIDGMTENEQYNEWEVEHDLLDITKELKDEMFAEEPPAPPGFFSNPLGFKEQYEGLEELMDDGFGDPNLGEGGVIPRPDNIPSTTVTLADGTYSPRLGDGQGLDDTFKNWGFDPGDLKIGMEFDPIQFRHGNLGNRKVPAPNPSDSYVHKFKNMKITAYSESAAENGKAEWAGKTAWGPKLKMGIIAVSRNGNKPTIPFGTRFWIEDYGYAIVADVGGGVADNQFDCFFPDYLGYHKSFPRSGVKKVYKLDKFPWEADSNWGKVYEVGGSTSEPEAPSDEAATPSNPSDYDDEDARDIEDGDYDDDFDHGGLGSLGMTGPVEEKNRTYQVVRQKEVYDLDEPNFNPNAPQFNHILTHDSIANMTQLSKLDGQIAYLLAAMSVARGNSSPVHGFVLELDEIIKNTDEMGHIFESEMELKVAPETRFVKTKWIEIEQEEREVTITEYSTHYNQDGSSYTVPHTYTDIEIVDIEVEYEEWLPYDFDMYYFDLVAHPFNENPLLTAFFLQNTTVTDWLKDKVADIIEKDQDINIYDQEAVKKDREDREKEKNKTEEEKQAELNQIVDKTKHGWEVLTIRHKTEFYDDKSVKDTDVEIEEDEDGKILNADEFDTESREEYESQYEADLLVGNYQYEPLEEHELLDMGYNLENPNSVIDKDGNIVAYRISQDELRDRFKELDDEEKAKYNNNEDQYVFHHIMMADYNDWELVYLYNCDDSCESPNKIKVTEKRLLFIPKRTMYNYGNDISCKYCKADYVERKLTFKDWGLGVVKNYMIGKVTGEKKSFKQLVEVAGPPRQEQVRSKELHIYYENEMDDTGKFDNSRVRSFTVGQKIQYFAQNILEEIPVASRLAEFGITAGVGNESYGGMGGTGVLAAAEAFHEQFWAVKPTSKNKHDEVGGRGRAYFNKRFYGSSNQNEWCAMFVSTCAEDAGIPTDVITKSAAVDGHRTFAQQNGIYHTPKSGYKPKPGDLLFYAGRSHIALVHHLEPDGTVVSIEGNTTLNNGGEINYRRNKLNGGNIEGFQNVQYPAGMEPGIDGGGGSSGPTLGPGQTSSIPKHKDFKSYMGYDKITKRSSLQWRLQQSARTDKNGFRKYNGKYMIALGSHWGNVGDYVTVTLANGTKIEAIIGDQKADKHTDAKNMFHLSDGSFMEFIIDTPRLDSMVKRMGNASYARGQNFNSPAVSITRH